MGKPYKALLRSIDVLHNFTVPQFRVKMDLVPGLVTYVWFTPTRAGKYDVLCEELCGSPTSRCAARSSSRRRPRSRPGSRPTRHSPRRRRRSPATWPLDSRASPSARMPWGAGEGNPALNAPKLAGQGDWYLKRQLHLFKSGARGAHEKDTFGKMMAPMAATLADDAAIDNVVAYIKTLPDQPAPPTVTAHGSGGETSFHTCGGCHGVTGQGQQATNAPRLKGMSDWYMVTQLKNFRQGIRGAHANDPYGPQMVSMAAILTDDKSINDVVGYINTLK
jgi:cytochrome c oxidase subunit 2